MVRATVLRALVLTAAFAAALTPVTCLGENSSPLPAKATKLPAKATKKLPPELLSLLREKKMAVPVRAAEITKEMMSLVISIT